MSDDTKFDSSPENSDTHYWWLNANPRDWPCRLSKLGIGEQESYGLYNENGKKRRIYQNFLNAKTGDMVIGYETTPTKQIVAICRVAAEVKKGELSEVELKESELFFEKVEAIDHPIDYATLRKCPELEKMEFFTKNKMIVTPKVSISASITST